MDFDFLYETNSLSVSEVKQTEYTSGVRIFQWDITDIILTINIILGTHEPTPAELSVADCNDDDVVNVMDVVCIVNIFWGG